MSEKLIDSEQLFSGKVVKLRRDKITTYNGNIAFREVVDHNGGSAILVVSDNKVLLTKQYRYAYEMDMIEIPAGKRDGDEPFIQTAIRELEEETGFITNSLELMTYIYPTPGYVSEKIAIFLADNLTQGKINFDEDECIESFWVDLDKAYEMVCDGSIKDSKTIVAILMYYTKYLKSL